MATKSMNLNELKIARSDWPVVLTDKMDYKTKENYNNRKKAVDMYIDGVTLRTIADETGVNKTRIKRLVERCIEKDEKGNIYGYTSLLLWKNIKKSNGLFNKLLIAYPSLRKFISGNYFGDKNYTLEKNMNYSTLHSKFLNECKKLKVQDYEYPFNTKNKAYVSLINYINQLENINPNKTIRRENKNMIQKFYKTGFGRRYSSNPVAPYQVVQVDGHKIDMIYSLEVEDKEGTIIRMPAMRMWLIAVIDVATRVILGYSISPNENYSQTIVLKAMKNTIMPHQKINFKIKGFKYPNDIGFPSDYIVESEWAIFDTIMLDNAKSHLAKDVVNKITNDLKCTINFGSVDTPETRGIIERFFGTLEKGGYHKLPGTTGSNIYDNKRDEPEKESIKYNITFDDIMEITEYLIAEYNNSAHSALENQTPLQAMERKIHEAYMIPCKADFQTMEKVKELTNITVERCIRGGYAQGKKPYISYMGAKYHSQGVSLCMDLIGTKRCLST